MTPHTRWCAVIRKLGSTWLKGTPAMDLGHMNVILRWIYLNVGSVFRMWNVVLKWSICMLVLDVGIEIASSTIIIFTLSFVFFNVLSACCNFFFCVLSVCCLFVVYFGFVIMFWSDVFVCWYVEIVIICIIIIMCILCFVLFCECICPIFF